MGKYLEKVLPFSICVQTTLNSHFVKLRLCDIDMWVVVESASKEHPCHWHFHFKLFVFIDHLFNGTSHFATIILVQSINC